MMCQTENKTWSCSECGKEMKNRIENKQRTNVFRMFPNLKIENMNDILKSICCIDYDICVCMIMNYDIYLIMCYLEDFLGAESDRLISFAL